MPLRLSTGLVDKLMDTGSFKTLFENAADGFLIDIYTGAQPADANDAATGTKLVTISKGGDGTGMTFEASAGTNPGELEKNAGETWSGTSVATGTAGWFRVYRKADAATHGDASTTEYRVDGTVGTSGQQMNVGSLSITSGAPFVLTSAAFTLPKA
jgi:hypothetical protein